MKKNLLIAALTLLIFSSCKKNESETLELEKDSVVLNDTNSMPNKNVETDTLAIDSSATGIPNRLSVTTTTKVTDESKGKFALSETKWKLVELNGKTVSSDTGKDYYINLDSKTAKFAAYVGCENVVGSYVMTAETKLPFSKISLTKIDCPNSDFESKFIKTLEKVDNYVIEDSGKVLYFQKSKMSTLAKFEAVK